MLNLLAPDAKAVVAQAYSAALRDGTQEIREEHLLDALLEDADGLRLLGAAIEHDRAEIRVEIEQARRRAGVTATQASALAEFGIDLDAVVAQVEDKLGSGALAGPQAEIRRWRGPDVSPTVIGVLQEAERQLRTAGGRTLGVQHLVLGILTAPSAVAESLARRGVTPAGVRSSIAAARQSAAR